MRMKDRILASTVCAVFGFMGGIFSNLFFIHARAAAAQQTSTVVRAEAFQVINKRGELVGELRANDSNNGELWFGRNDLSRVEFAASYLDFSYNNKRRLSMGVFRQREGPAIGAITLYNDEGKDRWHTESKY